MKEQQIIEACRQGDMLGFGELYDAYIENIYRFIYFRTHHRQTAEDLTSTTFVKAMEHIGQFTSGSFSSWLYRIARNTVIDHYRTTKVADPLDEAMTIESAERTETGAERSIAMERAQQYLATLKKEHREIVLMRLWDELPYDRIAEITGKSSGHCKVIVSRSLQLIRGRFPLAAASIIFLLIYFFSNL